MDSTIIDNVAEEKVEEIIEEQKDLKANETSEMSVDDDQISESENESSEQDSSNEDVKIERVHITKKLFRHKFRISGVLKPLFNPKGSILKNLCTDTKTNVKYSRKKKEVVITGSSKKNIIRAKLDIEELIHGEKDNKVRYTHFLSIPTNTEEIKNNFNKFRNDVLTSSDFEASQLKEEMFQKPEKLHLTICMLHLLNDFDEKKAIKGLVNCKKEIIDPVVEENGPIEIELKGLKCLNDNPAKARILYINVHDKNDFLQRITDAISKYFIQQGLSRKEYDKVVLHQTVINTFYQKKNKLNKVQKHFDATSFLKDHAETSFGKIKLSNIHLSNLFQKSPDGYFEATSKIEF